MLPIKPSNSLIDIQTFNNKSKRSYNPTNWADNITNYSLIKYNTDKTKYALLLNMSRGWFRPYVLAPASDLA